MTDVLETFDLGVSPNAIVAGANGIDSIVEGAQVYEAGYHNVGVRAGGAANTANTRYKIDLGMTGNHYGSVYLNNKTAHGHASSSVNFFYLTNTTTGNMVRFRVRPGNALSIIAPEPTEVRVGTAGDIPVNSWFRFDWNLTGTTLTWKIFYDPDASAASTPDLTGTVTTGTGTADKIVFGAQSSASLIKDWSMDTFRVTNTGSWFEPYSTAPENGDTTLWTGTEEVPVTTTLWTGTEEVAISATEISV